MHVSACLCVCECVCTWGEGGTSAIGVGGYIVCLL